MGRLGGDAVPLALNPRSAISRRWFRSPRSPRAAANSRTGEARPPSGKALKFLHRKAYDDTDSTYDLITASLDEKGLEAKNRFVEEYLTDTKESDERRAGG
jgi:effector-binding domain-containing protein